MVAEKSCRPTRPVRWECSDVRVARLFNRQMFRKRVEPAMIVTRRHGSVLRGNFALHRKTEDDYLSSKPAYPLAATSAKILRYSGTPPPYNRKWPRSFPGLLLPKNHESRILSTRSPLADS